MDGKLTDCCIATNNGFDPERMARLDRYSAVHRFDWHQFDVLSDVHALRALKLARVPSWLGVVADIFVSYASADRECVRPIVEALVEAGFSVWWDREIGLGRSFDTEIEQELDRAKSVLVVWSKNSVGSDWVRNEAQEGFDRNILVPIQIDDVKPPLGFRRLQTAFMAQPDRMVLDRIIRSVGLVVRGGSSQRRTPRSHRLPVSDAKQSRLNSIAIMPFDDLSPGGDHAWLGRGMADALAESLTRIHGLRIPGRASSARLKQEGLGVLAIGEQLNVATVVEGTIQCASTELVVSVQWVRVKDDSKIWSARYRRTIDDVFAIQDEIGASVAEAIRTELGIKDVHGNLLKGRYRTADVRAWELVVKALDLLFTLAPESIKPIGDLCRQAIAIDPRYASAYSLSAYSVSQVDHGLRLVEQALELDPTDTLAHYVLSTQSMNNWDFKTAEEMLIRERESDPLDTILIFPFVHMLCATGRLEEALEQAQRGVNLEPLFPQYHALLGATYLSVGMHEAAIESFEYALTIGFTPDFFGSMALAYQYAGRSEDALEAMVRFSPDNEEAIRDGYRGGGWEGMNLSLANAIQSLNPKTCVAWELANAGDRDGMYACLERMVESPLPAPMERWRGRLNPVAIVPWMGDAFLPHLLNASPALAPYRHESSFQRIRDRMTKRMKL